MNWWNGWSISVIILIILVALLIIAIVVMKARCKDNQDSIESPLFSPIEKNNNLADIELGTSCLSSNEIDIFKNKEAELKFNLEKMQTENQKLRSACSQLENELNFYKNNQIPEIKLSDIGTTTINSRTDVETVTAQNIDNEKSMLKERIQTLESRIESLNLKQQLLILHFQKQLDEKENMMKYQKINYDTILNS